jgi:hypothetical protein
MTTATAHAADPKALRRQIEVQRDVVAEAETVVACRRAWHAEQRTTASHAGLLDALRDLRFYKGHLATLVAQLDEAEGVSR